MKNETANLGAFMPQHFWGAVLGEDVPDRCAYLTEFIELIPIGITAIHLSTGKVLFANDEFAQMIGRTSQDVAGMDWKDLCTSESAHDAAVALESANNFGRYGWVQTYLPHSSGRRVKARLRGNVVRRANGEEFLLSLCERI